MNARPPLSEVQVRTLHNKLVQLETECCRLADAGDDVGIDRVADEMFDVRDALLLGIDDTAPIDPPQIAARVSASLNMLNIAAGPAGDLPWLAAVQADLARIVAGEDLSRPAAA